MCLERITKQYKNPTTAVRQAYKAVRCSDSRYYSAFQDTPLPLGKWIKAQEMEIQTENFADYWDGKKTYTSGFHVIATKKEAKAWLRYMQWNGTKRLKWKIVPVKVKGITVIGPDGSDDDPTFLEASYTTLVAQEMMVPKPRKSRKTASLIEGNPK